VLRYENALTFGALSGHGFTGAEKVSSRVILSEAKCRSLLEDLAVIGTKDPLFICLQ
jgi:hypothetical protein